MHIKKSLFIVKASTPFEISIERELAGYITQLADLLNGGLRFDENINNQLQTVTASGAADIEFAVTHTLKRIPVGFIVVNIDKAGIVYSSGTAWTATTIYLKCNTAHCEVKLMIF